MITYRDTSSGRSINVYFDKRLVGTIKPNGQHWCYYPKGSSVPGDSYRSIAAVKRSLENDTERTVA
jgi:hypothetical protein